MQKAADLADGRMNVIRNVEQEMSKLVAVGMQKPVQWEAMSYEDKISHIDQLQGALGNVSTVTNKLEEMAEKEKDTLRDLSNMGVQPVANQSVVAKARFNLRKHAQELQQPPVSSVPTDTNNDGQTSVSEVRTILDGFVSDHLMQGTDHKKAIAHAVDQAFAYITDNFTNPNDSSTDPMSGAQGNSEQLVRNAVTTYYSTADESEKDQAASVLARTVFPQSGESSTVPAQEKSVKVDFAKVVEETNRVIQALAQKDAKKTTFNLTKQAHTKNIVIFDPEKVTKDEFYGGAMSDNDLLERNKGFGLRLDGYYTANWEKAWRENVMDKYDPFYIERRFEVDRNVPVGSNYQLEPGETRRPYLPEHGLTEARLEANRDEMNKERGYEPSSKGVVFNWKEASAKKKAQLAPLQAPQALRPLQAPKSPFEEKPLAQIHRCSKCGNPLKLDPRTKAPVEGVCSKCNGTGQVAGEIKTAPDPVKLQQTQNLDIEKLSNSHSGIFFHNGKFVVVAGKKKKQFDTYYEAKEFKQLPAEPSSAQPPAAVNPPKRNRLTPEQLERRREVSQHADGLGIDG